METPDDIFKHIQDFLGYSPENINILEAKIDIAVQMDYFNMASKIREEDVKSITYSPDELLGNQLTTDQVKEYLIVLAGAGDVANFRIIESYIPLATDETGDWALIALNESRFNVINSLTDGSNVFISTGLGGKKGMLRYFIVFIPEADDFTQAHEQLVIDEIYFSFKRSESEVESVEVVGRFICATVLIPVNIRVDLSVKSVIDECVKSGCPISTGYVVTNVKQLTLDEINRVINKQPVDGMDFDEI
ncbi:MAG: hypothetical protein AB7S54_01915 [Bacteroidales bacterium]